MVHLEEYGYVLPVAAAAFGLGYATGSGHGSTLVGVGMVAVPIVGGIYGPFSALNGGAFDDTEIGTMVDKGIRRGVCIPIAMEALGYVIGRLTS